MARIVFIHHRLPFTPTILRQGRGASHRLSVRAMLMRDTPVPTASAAVLPAPPIIRHRAAGIIRFLSALLLSGARALIVPAEQVCGPLSLGWVIPPQIRTMMFSIDRSVG